MDSEVIFVKANKLKFKLDYGSKNKKQENKRTVKTKLGIKCPPVYLQV